MKRIITVFVFTIFIITLKVFAFNYVVHDPVSYLQDTTKAAQDELFQQLNLKNQLESIGITEEQLKTIAENLRIAKEQLAKLKETYNVAMTVRNNIGDPMALVAYLNSKFLKDDLLDQSLGLVRDADRTNFNDIDYYSIYGTIDDIEDEIRRVKDNEEIFHEGENKYKSAVDVQKFYLEGPGSISNSIKELRGYDDAYNPRQGDLNNTTYANYKTTTWLANSFAQKRQSDLVYQRLHIEHMNAENKIRMQQAIERERQLKLRNEEIKRNRSEINKGFKELNSFFDD